MKELIVVGKKFALDRQRALDALSANYDTLVIDMLAAGEALANLKDRHIFASILRVSTIDHFAALMAAAHNNGTRLTHCICRDPWAVNLGKSALWKLGLCGHINFSMPAENLVSAVEQLCAACDGEAHDAWAPSTSRMLRTEFNSDGSLDEVDREITSLLSRGFTDQQIADALNFSVQTIRNRVSHMLKLHGFENRTTLASAHLQTAFREALNRHNRHD